MLVAIEVAISIYYLKEIAEESVVPSFENQEMNGNGPWRFHSPSLLMFL
jgi:hypothetical protein